ncbi:hypothetical protein AUC43_00910 [Hymenobacter sedentarius]|uniref:Uncharacterized protein n=1 Tax=Hymenobacter sedentarius TaxID=1411621 RepID=A0A0U4A6E2_9BACT|nr:hypothetical protein [Hymenobacter sedentarius]ALW83788.1 hypothetical protein AUC43_00910 [Hymenobacter sedentarius]
MTELAAEIHRAIQAYCAQARALPLTATDFYDWLAALPPDRRAEVKAQGMRASKAEPEFLSFCLEWRGYTLWNFMAGHLSLEAFDHWVASGQSAGKLPRRQPAASGNTTPHPRA